MMERRNMRITCRFYDEDFIEMAEELLKKRTAEFSSKDELCKKAAEKEIRRMYSELYEDKISNVHKLEEKDIVTRIDQNFVLLNIILKIVCSLYNIEIDKLCKKSPDLDNLAEGLYDELPLRFEAVIAELFRN